MKMADSKKATLRIFTFTLVLLFCLSCIAPLASAMPGSQYINSYSASMTAGSNGNVTIWFQISGTGTMDQIGSTTIEIYENGTRVRIYQHTSTSGMMAYNKLGHSGSITYSGVVGRQYRAHVTFQAGKNGGWDNRSVNSNIVTAKK